MTSPPDAQEPSVFSAASRPDSRAETIRRKLLALEPWCAELDPDAGWDCPSASSSLSTTPESSLPTTPSEEVLSDECLALAPAVSYSSGTTPYDEPKDGIDTEKRTGSLRRIIRKLESLSSLKLSTKKHGNRLENVKDIFQLKLPLNKKRAPTSSVDVRDSEKATTCELTGDLKYSAPILPGEYLHMQDPLDSMASLAAVHGSPTECDGSFTYFSGELDTEGRLTRYTPLDAITLSALPRLLLKAIFFIPYTVVVGLAPMMFPVYLSTVTFSPAFGYVTRPTTPFRTFGHHARMLPYHVAVASGVIALLSCWSLAFAIASVAIVIGATWWAWYDFNAQGDGSGLELGADDRMSIYWIIHGVYLGKSDMVCTLCDLNRLCTDADADLDRYEATEEEGYTEEKNTEVFQEDDGTIDCIIRVPGNDAGESGTEMRIIVQCVD